MSMRTVLENLESVNSKYGMFHDRTHETDPGDAKFLFSAKDNLTSKDMETCAGSRILEGYHPAFDATAIARMREAGGMPQTSSEREAAQAAFRGAARALFISGDTIGAFLASATPGQVAACTAMLESEIAHRDRARRARLLRQARFPVPKSAGGFDWPDVAFPDGWGRDEMLSLAFVRDAEDLVFYGQTGRGKTHMATALGIAATSAGYPVRFWQTAQLVLQLGKAKREGTLDRLLADVAKARLLVLDEFGYVPFDVDGARLLYQVISDSYERPAIRSQG